MQSTKAAGILGVCEENKRIENCPAGKVRFPTYPKDSKNTARLIYRLEKNDLGDFSYAEASTSVKKMLNKWESVSNISFEESPLGPINESVNVLNFHNYLEPFEPLNYSPIIFDNGNIVDALVGYGAREDILGFATTSFFNFQGKKLVSIAESQALFNGYLYKLDNRPDIKDRAELKAHLESTILHEFAHMVGLDHSQGAEITKFKEGKISEMDLSAVPVMFPVGISSSTELKHDDIAAINMAYPKDELTSNLGCIRGSLSYHNKGVKGLNVIAFNLENENPYKDFVTSAVDYDGEDQGNFSLENLKPGTYALKVEPIYEKFVGGSSVGIHEGADENDYNSGFLHFENSEVKDLDDFSEVNKTINTFDVEAGGKVLKLNFDLDERESVKLRGRALKKPTFLYTFRDRTSILKIRKIGKGASSFELSTDYPELVEFQPNVIEFGKKEKVKKVRVNYASFEEFGHVFPEISLDSVKIPVHVQDVNTREINRDYLLKVE
jgi:hypothetical protein